MTTAMRNARRTFAAAYVTIAAVLTLASCSETPSPGSTSAADASNSSPAKSLSPLVAPKTTQAEDAGFLTDVTEADPALVSYEQQQGNVALRALLTDGSAFCAFLQQGEQIDSAMVDVAAGADSVESQTHLPSTVTTFNTIEAVALLTLCPSDLRRLPPADQSKIRSLGVALGKIPG
jgi:hypothetical protein